MAPMYLFENGDKRIKSQTWSSKSSTEPAILIIKRGADFISVPTEIVLSRFCFIHFEKGHPTSMFSIER